MDRYRRWFVVGLVVMALPCGAAEEASARPSTGSGRTEGESKGPAAKAESGKEAPREAEGGNGSASTMFRYLFDRKPAEGSAAKRVEDAAMPGLVRAQAEQALGLGPSEGDMGMVRFEQFLSTEEVSEKDVEAYWATYRSVLDLLKGDRVNEAVGALHELAREERIDAGISRDLAARVEAIWTTEDAVRGIETNNKKLREHIERSNRNADVMADSVKDREIDFQRKMKHSGLMPDAKDSKPKSQIPEGFQAPPGQSGGAPGGVGTDLTTMGLLTGKLRLTEEYLRSLEARAKIKLNEMKADQLVQKAKEDFAAYVTGLFEGRQFLQVVMGADFYRRIFDEGEYPPEMAGQVNASLRAIQDIRDAVGVVRYKLERDDVARAAETLQAVFAVGERHPEVAGLERGAKERISAYLRKLGEVRNLIEARDFGSLDGALDAVKAVAPDFDTSRPRALVNAVKLESQLRLGKAKLLAQQGDLPKAMEEFQAAGEAWPANPALETAAKTFFETHEMKSQSTVEFDRFVASKDYRGMFEKQLALAPAIAGDAGREKQLKDALERVKAAEVAVEKANLLVLNGNVFGAWETLERAAGAWPEDAKLQRLRADFASRAVEFVSALQRAREAEAREDIGYSLAWWVNARQHYPASEFAKEAIDRLSQRILRGTTNEGGG